MGVRDDELKRLTQYANSMGVRVVYKTLTSSSTAAADWSLDGDEIRIFISPKSSKINTILCLIHELGHQLSHIYDDDRKNPRSLVRALEKEAESIPLTRHQRWLILKSELAGMQWWHIIYNETKMSFPIKKMWLMRDWDQWWYTYYFQVGRPPKKSECAEKLRQLREVYYAEE
jgi:hypothetical protein